MPICGGTGLAAPDLVTPKTVADDSLTPALAGRSAELQLAARQERYDRAGSTTGSKIAAQFFVGDCLSLRASWGTSFQAPSVLQAASNTSSRTLGMFATSSRIPSTAWRSMIQCPDSQYV